MSRTDATRAVRDAMLDDRWGQGSRDDPFPVAVSVYCDECTERRIGRVYATPEGPLLWTEEPLSATDQTKRAIGTYKDQGGSRMPWPRVRFRQVWIEDEPATVSCPRHGDRPDADGIVKAWRLYSFGRGAQRLRV